MADTTLLIEDHGHKTAKYYLPVFSAWVGSFSLGTVLGYSSPALPSLDDPGSHIHMTGFLKSFFVSLMALGALFGCICAGFFNESFGRKGTLIFTTLPFIAGWALIACSGNLDSIVTLMIGRCLTGFCCGLISLTAPNYIAETSDPERRGFFGSGFQLNVTFGIVMTYVFGKYFNWADLALLMTVFPFILLVTILFMPESPSWLMKKGRISEANDANLFLHGAEGSRRLSVDISPPMDGDASEGVFKQIHYFSMPQYYKPLIIAVSLMFFQQFSGVNAIITAMHSIFKKANFDTISADDSAIIVGFIQVFATLIACILSDRFGRKRLTVISSFGTGISLVPLVVFDYILSEKNISNFSQNFGWIPICSIVSFIIFFSLGLGPIPWLIMGELFPIRVKGFSSILVSSFNWFGAFLIISIFYSYIDLYYVYIFFSFNCFASALFAIFFLPETKGKSFTEIENMFTPNDGNES